MKTSKFVPRTEAQARSFAHDQREAARTRARPGSILGARRENELAADVAKRTAHYAGKKG